ncbi:MAG TPA: DUF3159 domain-containing protein [Microbacteriaceae bacterium]|nr:DUF3159 domain-containing protein [Microbacteriaceae bacterium]
MNDENKNTNKLSSSGLVKGVQAGISGENASLRGVLAAVGGFRGILEALLPGLLYLVIYIVIGDARLSAIAPATIAILIVVIRLISRQTLVTAISGILGVAIAVLTTLFTGKGEDFFLPGFWINGIWIVALTVSLLLRWPLIGFLVGLVRNDFTAWKNDKMIYAAAKFSSLIWLTLFVLRLVIQVPFYLAGDVAALGVARLVMGTPLFALVILFTWLLFRKTLTTAD